MMSLFHFSGGFLRLAPISLLSSHFHSRARLIQSARNGQTDESNPFSPCRPSCMNMSAQLFLLSFSKSLAPLCCFLLAIFFFGAVAFFLFGYPTLSFRPSLRGFKWHCSPLQLRHTVSSPLPLFPSPNSLPRTCLRACPPFLLLRSLRELCLILKGVIRLWVRIRTFPLTPPLRLLSSFL